MELGPVDILFVLGVVTPGLMYIYYGLRTWRKEEVAMESWFLAVPFGISVAIIVISAFMYDAIGGTADKDAFDPDTHSMDLFYPGLLVFIDLAVLSMIIVAGHGHILIFRGRRITVLGAVHKLLDRRGLRYDFDDDVLVVPSIKMKVQVNDFPKRNLVGVSLRSRDKDWREIIHEDILNTFKGTPTVLYHPVMIMIGCILLGIGIILGAAYLIG